MFNHFKQIGTAMSKIDTRQKQKQQGFTLVELSITLVLIAGFLLTGLYFVQRIQLENAVNKTVADAAVSMNAAIAATSGDATTTGHTVSTLATMNVWPKDRLIFAASGGVTAVAGQFPGSVETIEANSIAVGTNMPIGQGFVFTLDNIPSEACASIVKNLALHPNVVEVRAGGKGLATANLVALRTSSENAIQVSRISGTNACGGSAAKKLAVSFTKS